MRVRECIGVVCIGMVRCVRLSCMWVCVTVLLFRVGHRFLKPQLGGEISLVSKGGANDNARLIDSSMVYVLVWSFA